MEKIFQEFGRIISQGRILPLYQPVLSLDEYRIAGYRTFLRGPPESVLHSPTGLLTAARMSGKQFQLEKSYTKAAIDGFVRFELPGLLFKNFPPSYLLGASGARLGKRLEKHGLDGQRLVVHMNITPGSGDWGVVAEAMGHCRELGFRISLDELAVMAMEEGRLRDSAPDFVHIGRHFTADIQESLDKQRFIERLAAIVQSHCPLIAEGVETAEAYYTLRHLGIDYAQGNFFSRPSHYPPMEIPKSLFFPANGGYRKFYGDEVERMGGLARAVAHVEPTDKTGDVLQQFVQNPTLQSMPVTYQREPVGIIRREHLADIFLTPYGRDLFGKTPILNFMDQNPLVVESSASIHEVSRLIVERGQAQDNQDFVITRNGVYLGMGKVVDVLKRITEMQLRDAVHANPLSGLPGNVPIESAISNLLKEGQPFTVCYIDLDNFKPYNDCYGYEKGDEAIRLVAQLAVEATDPEQDFVGHIGGDDFILLFRAQDWQARCERLLEAFAARVPDFYNEVDRKRGGLIACDRQGRELFFPLLSLSIGAVSPRNCATHHCVAAMAAEAKKQAKKQPGNNLFVERREHGKH